MKTVAMLATYAVGSQAFVAPSSAAPDRSRKLIVDERHLASLPSILSNVSRASVSTSTSHPFVPPIPSSTLVPAVASAFHGATLTTPTKSSSAVKMSFENEIGAQPPLGFWDPLYLLENADQERFDRLRYVEIKHGRISMLAVLGHIIQENVRLPGMLSTSENIAFADMPNGLTAFEKLPILGSAQIFAFIGFLELFVMKQKPGSFPGDMSWINPFQKQWDAFDEETKEKKRAIELNNGRAAQMGILGMMAHEVISNQPYIINNFLGSSYPFP